MNIIKDTVLEVGHLVWQVRPPRPSLTVVAKATFALGADGPCTLAAEQQPVTGPVFHDDDPMKSPRLDTDLAIWKIRGECFLAGTCYPPGAKPAKTSAVGFQVGPVSKTLAVIGDRSWSSMGVLSSPKPFTSMPLSYERSFGGPGVDANPLGSPVPNIEDPRELMTSPGSKPKPAGAFPLSPDWKSRLQRSGRYDKKWLATRWPYFPEDFDGSFFNAAPEDQWIDGFWRGDEEIVLQNLHPRQALVRTRLPALRARVFLMEKGSGFREVPLRLDTISVDADAGLVFVLWRGMVEVRSESLEEVDFLYAAHEPLSAPLSVEAHQARFEQKLVEREQEDEAFEPEEPPSSAEPQEEEKQEAAPEPPDIEELIRKLGVPMPEEDLEPETAKTPAENAEALAQAFAAAGLSEEEGVKELVAELRAPQEPPEPEPVSGEVSTRERLVQRLKEKQSVAGQDWSGADLSGLDISGVDLSKAILQGGSLRGARLDGAKLEGAVLSGVDLSGASLKKASLGEADLTGVRAASACFDEADLENTTLNEGDFSAASFQRAKCAGAQFVQALLTQVDFREACLDEADLSDARLEEARLEGASLKETELSGADATRANFDGANLTQLRASRGVRMAQASFKRVQAAQSKWSGAMLDEADFSFSELERADFSGASLVKTCFNGCNVAHGRFEGARMVGASLLKANAFEAQFEATDLTHADLRGASLFGAELWKAQTGSARLERTVLTRTKLADHS